MRRGWWIRAAAALAAAVALVAGLPQGHVAAEEQNPPPPSNDRPTQVGALPVDSKTGPLAGMLIWSKGRRAYQFLQIDDFLGGGQTGGVTGAGTSGLAAFNLDTLQPVNRFENYQPHFYSPSYPSMIGAVDEAGGRLFIPTRGVKACFIDWCVGGIKVINGQSLAVERTINLPVTATLTVAPKLTAITYSPPRGNNDRAKLHLLLDETAHYVKGAEQAKQSTTVLRAVQIDAETGSIDWSFRVDACTRYRFEEFQPMAGENAIFRSRQRSKPSETVLWVGCVGAGTAAQVVRVAVDEALPLTSTQQAFSGPTQPVSMIGDPVSDRLLIKNVGAAEQWWVFDGKKSTFIGVIGIGPLAAREAAFGFDAATGRLYVMAPLGEGDAVGGEPPREGGLIMADARRTPVAQRAFTEFGSLGNLAAPPSREFNTIPIEVDTGAADGKPRLLFRPGKPAEPAPWIPPPRYHVLKDPIAVDADPQPEDPDVFTEDVEEREGLTRVTYKGRAGGYGVRAILVGGYEAVPRSASFDVSGIYRSPQAAVFGDCGPIDREFLLGSVGPAELSETASRAEAHAFATDPTTADDLENFTPRCGKVKGKKQPIGNQTVEVPDQEIDAGEPPIRRVSGVDCIAPDDDPKREQPDPVGDSRFAGFRSEAKCGSQASGLGQARVLDLADVKVADAHSEFKMFRDPQRGLVVRVESYARGIDIAGKAKIDSVWAVVETWSKGRSQPKDVAENPNCDFTRTAGTCVARSIMGLSTPDNPDKRNYPEGHEQQFVEALGRALGREWKVSIRTPDQELAAGTDGGYQAGFQKPEDQKFADETLNNDALLAVPSLELVRVVDGVAGRGRQVFQFAGAQTFTGYGVEDLTDEIIDDDDDGGPGAIDIELLDDAEKPLPGGLFKVYKDSDGDGLLGQIDDLLDGGVCLTGADGHCRMDNVPPGDYVVDQVDAPAGYAPAPDVFVPVESASVSNVRAVNLKAVGGIKVTLTDDAATPQPLKGGTFQVFSDNGDGKLSQADPQFKSCTTAEDGTCEFTDVPLGAYIVHESAAPEGFTSSDDAAFSLAQPGQIAELSIVNGLKGSEGTPDEPATPGTPGTPSSSASDNVPEIDFDTPSPPTPIVSSTPMASNDGGGNGNGAPSILAAPGAAARFLIRNLGDALLFGGVWGLFGGAAVLVTRRRKLAWLLSQTTR